MGRKNVAVLLLLTWFRRLVASRPSLSTNGALRQEPPSVRLHGTPRLCDVGISTASALPSKSDLVKVLSLRGGAKDLTVVNENEKENSRFPSQVVSSKVQAVGKTYRRVRRTQFLTMVLLRIAFVLISPLAIFAVVLTVALSLIMTALRIIFLNFCFRDTSRLVYAATRAATAILLACITGLFSPPFAVFGVLAAVSLAGLDMAEPLLRIRYRRQMRKLRHLHKLITDPVLMESMEVVLRGAQAVASASARAVESSGRGAIRGAQTIASASAKAAEASGRSAVGLTVRGKKAIGEGAASLSRRGKQAMDDAAAKELVETLLQSSGAVKLRESMQSTMPSSVAAWAEDQYLSLRRSGAFEAVVSRALDALGRELSGAAEFLPYLEAIEAVRKKQGHTITTWKTPSALAGNKSKVQKRKQ